MSDGKAFANFDNVCYNYRRLVGNSNGSSAPPATIKLEPYAKMNQWETDKQREDSRYNLEETTKESQEDTIKESNEEIEKQQQEQDVKTTTAEDIKEIPRSYTEVNEWGK